MARGLRGFVSFEAGLTRGAVPEIEPLEAQVRELREARKRLKQQDRPLSTLKAQLARRDKRIERLRKGSKNRARTQQNLWVADSALRRFQKWLFIRTGALQWGTKSFEFWTFLMVLLALVRPKSVVELGSGRSTSYLTEYAMKEGIPFASIEENRFYVARNRLGLRHGFLSDGYLHHVPTGDDGWYRVEELNRVVDFPCELLFVDGPTEYFAPGSRTTERSLKWLAAASVTSKVLIVDDVDRRSNLEMFHKLVALSARKLCPLYLSFNVIREELRPNVIAIAVEPPSYDVLGKVCSEIGIELLNDYSVD
jgi:hypothetical protein